MIRPPQLARSPLLALLVVTSACGKGPRKTEGDPGRQHVVLNALPDTVKRLGTLRTSLLDARDRRALAADVFAVPRAVLTRDRPLKPRRFFGPWFAGSDLSQIQVSVKARVSSPSPTWYYGGFFASVVADDPPSDLAVYSQYVQNPTTRTETPAQLFPVPGQAPTTPAPQIKEMRFTLNGVFARSRYGGTVELQFQSSDDFEYEVTGDTIWWDIGQLRMSVYITPLAAQLNPVGPSQPSAFRSLVVEFEPSAVTAYSIATGNVKPDPALPDLQAILDDLAESIEATNGKPYSHQLFKRDANQFAHAWIHVQQYDLFAPNQSPPERVDAIEIGDQHLMLRTHVPDVHFSWSLQLLRTAGGAGSSLVSEGLLSEIVGSLLFEVGMIHDLAGEPLVHGPNYAWRLAQLEPTLWMPVGTFRLDQCDALNFAVAVIFAHDGPSLSDDLLRHVYNSTTLVPPDFQGLTSVQAILDVDCAELNAFVQNLRLPTPLAQAPNRVLFVIREQSISLIDEDLNPRGNYTIFAKLELTFL